MFLHSNQLLPLLLLLPQEFMDKALSRKILQQASEQMREEEGQTSGGGGRWVVAVVVVMVAVIVVIVCKGSCRVQYSIQ